MYALIRRHFQVIIDAFKYVIAQQGPDVHIYDHGLNPDVVKSSSVDRVGDLETFAQEFQNNFLGHWLIWTLSGF